MMRMLSTRKVTRAKHTERIVPHPPEANVSNQVEHPEAVTLVDFHLATEEVLKVGHEGTDSANNQVTHNTAVNVPETGVSENEIIAGNNEEAEEYLPQRPVRNRRPPNMLHYDLIGNPTEYPPYVTSVQATNSRFPPQETFRPLIPASPPILAFHQTLFLSTPFPFLNRPLRFSLQRMDATSR